jgi:Lipase (class 3)
MDWNKAIQYANLVNAAYCKFENKPYATPGFVEAGTIYGNDLATRLNPGRGNNRVIIGLILQAQGTGDLVVAFRGTEGIKEWVQDAQFGTTPFTPVPGSGQTEDGFTAMYLSMRVGNQPGALGVVSALPGILGNRAATSLTVCGHSLGGSLATLFAMDVAANAPATFNSLAVYTYASPRTGDRDFVAKYTELVSTTNRFADNVDLVPQLPTDPPYQHVVARLVLDSLTLIPPRVRLQPNPLCWHILSSYIYLLSLYAGGAEMPPEAECAPGVGVLVQDILAKVQATLSNEQQIKDQFTNSPRTNMGAN